MTYEAKTRDGRAVHVADYQSDEWEALKLSSRLGDYVMSCCPSPAVLKTSINGVRFFSHLADECANAPETIWHQDGKEAVLAALRALGLEGRDEVPGKAPDGRKWIADVLFTVGARTVAIELQRSPQTLREFLARQTRYQASGVECYWLLRQEVHKTFMKASGREVQKRFSDRLANGTLGQGLLPELPVGLLRTEDAITVFGGYAYNATVQEWLNAIVQGTFGHRDWAWWLDTSSYQPK